MRPGFAAAIAVAIAAASPVAGAGTFGGFAADEARYLDGRDRICQPLADSDQGQPNCAKGEPRDLASAAFRRTSVTRAYRARTVGKMTIEILDAAGNKVRTWQAAGIVSSITGVFVSPKARMVAVEYQARDLGRIRASVVAFVVRAPTHKGAAAGGSVTGQSTNRATGPTGRIVVGKVKRPADLEKALATAKRQLARRQYGKAAKSLAAHARKHPGDPAVRYALAAAAAGAGNGAEAVAELRRLAALDHAEVPIWMVEARTDRAFDKLRADSAFRRAIGLDAGERSPTAYELAVGLGGVWEQPGSPCNEPKVELRLKRAKQKFRLTIASICQGTTDRTRLSGTWTTQGATTLTLIFPNPGQDDETMVCELKTCEAGNETCASCGADSDMGFVLRPTRR